MLLALSAFVSIAYAACTGPQGVGGDMIFNSDHAVMQYCNDTNWISFPKSDLTPDAFVFNALTGQSPATLVTSNTVTIAGIDGTVSVTISGDGSPEFSINGGAWVTTGSLVDGDTLQLRMTTGAVSTQYTASVSVGSGSAEWEVATIGSDTTPNAFAFTDVTDVATNTLITSSAITISGINSATPVSVSGDGSPQIRINGGAWVTSGNISNGQSLQVRLTSSASIMTMLSATVDVGGVTNQWDVTTGGPTGQQLFTASSTSFVVPAGVTNISAVVIGPGGTESSGKGGGGGNLRWISSLAVTPGETLSVTNDSNGPRIRRGTTVLLASNSTIGGVIGGGNGGSGGTGYSSSTTKRTGGGGGAGGYSGNGGNGGGGSSNGAAGNGGGGGGGAGANGPGGENNYGGRGGGVGVLGQGSSGAGGLETTGGGGSGGAGSGGSGSTYGGGSGSSSGAGGGAIRIIWGPGRAYPSTNTGNM